MGHRCFLNICVGDLLASRNYGAHTGAWSGYYGRRFVEQVGLEGGLSWEQEKHFRYENITHGSSEVGVDQCVWVRVPLRDELT